MSYQEPRRNHDLVLACECGSTLKASSLSEAELATLEHRFSQDHFVKQRHQEVSPLEATRFRAAQRKWDRDHPVHVIRRSDPGPRRLRRVT